VTSLLGLGSAACRRVLGCWAVSLLTELNAFYTEHEGSGELEGGVDGPVVWMTCECGAKIARAVGDEGSR
jgi:hypothetical protein